MLCDIRRGKIVLLSGEEIFIPLSSNEMFRLTWIRWPLLSTLLLGSHILLVVAQCGSSIQDRQESQDRQDKLALYKITMRTYWSRARFPRHYPEWKPPAQFGKLIAFILMKHMIALTSSFSTLLPGSPSHTPFFRCHPYHGRAVSYHYNNEEYYGNNLRFHGEEIGRNIDVGNLERLCLPQYRERLDKP
ncbi:uncharacterized protein LOC118445173 [Vespa mandarinia]|uniref:uncharacterized protein LOC118445173 n=1 Tax=Vespa mandarinia TaxID=7446 RepID=UPI0016114A23|nr:uncharacterized protein LOC118445173 [Vespa mandarinia]